MARPSGPAFREEGHLQSVHALILVKDEALLLPGLLGALQGAVSQVWVGDTGSQDGSVAIAEGAGAKVVHLPWTDHFADARNALQAQLPASGWAMWLDADHLPNLEGPALKAWLQGAVSLPPPQGAQAGQVWGLRVPLVQLDAGQTFGHGRWPMLSPLGQGVRWEGRLHERQVGPDGLPLRWQDGPEALCLRHVGYSGDRLEAKGKRAHYAKLLAQSLEEEPHRARWWGFSAHQCLQTGQDSLALEHCDKALALGPEGLEEEAWFLRLRQEALLRLGRFAEASQMLGDWRRLKPQAVEPWAMLGLAQVAVGEAAPAVASLSLAIRLGEAQSLPPEHHELAGWLAAGALALALEMLGEGEQATEALAHALAAAPSPQELWARLALLLQPESAGALAWRALQARAPLAWRWLQEG